MVQRKQLSNGVRLVVEEMEHVYSVAIGIWIHTGSRHERRDENGISHFIEHMLFKGTPSMNAGEIAEAFDRIGGHVNAFTSKEYTCFYTKVMNCHALEAASILSDMFFHSTFAEDEIEKERQVILEEIRMVEDTADDVVHDDLDRAAYGEHPIGLSILGTEASIQSFDREHLLGYVERQYRPENVVVSIAGSIDASLLDKITSDFTEFKPREVETNEEAAGKISGNRIGRAKAVEQAHLCLGFQGVSLVENDIYPMVLYNHLLGGGMSSRLFQEIREQRALAYSVFSYHTSYQDTGMLTVYAGTAPERLEESFSAITDAVKRFAKTDEITKEDIENAKAHVIGSTLLGLEGSSSKMTRNGRNELVLKEHQSLDELSANIDRITLNDVKRVAESVYEHEFAASLISPDGKLPL